MVKVCDKCHEETKFHVEQKDGTILCHACVKRETKEPRVAPTDDAFVRMCRRLRIGRETFPFDNFIADLPSGRCYTNGHVLLSDVDKTPMTVDGVDLDTLSELERMPYPNIGLVFRRMEGGKLIEIPEEFYGYLTAVFKPKKRTYVSVRIHAEGITVYTREQPEVVMNYREVTPGIDFEITIDAFYMAEMQPKEIRVSDGESAVRVEASYVSHVHAMDYVIIMPRQDAWKEG